MKKILLVCIAVFVSVGLLFAAGKQEKKVLDYQSMSWDEIVEEAKREGSLTIYMWWGEEFWKLASQGFKEKYEIDANVVMADHDALRNKILAEKDKAAGTIDVVFVGGQSVKMFMDADVFYGPILPIMPNRDKLDQKLVKVQEGVEIKDYLVPIYRNQTGLLYDPEKVSKPPQTWDELVDWIKANPKQFAYCDPSKGGSGQAFVHTTIGNLCGGLDKYYGDTDLVQEKVANWNLAWDWLNEMEEYTTITGSNYESIGALNMGECSLVVAWDDDTQVNLKKGTLFKRAKLYVPRMGFPGGGDTAGVLKNAPNKAAGLLFIDYLTEADVQIQMNDVIGSYLARTDVKGKVALLTEEERSKYGVAWIPVPYKIHFIREFVENVMMK